MAVDLAPLRHKECGLFSALRWHLNQFVIKRLHLLDLAGGKLTIFDAFGSPGDTLLSATVCRNLKARFPRIRLNLLTPNPDLVRLDPSLESINEPETTFCVWHWYLGLLESKNGTTNILKPTFDSLGISEYEYRAKVYLSPAEIAAAKARLSQLKGPIISINVMSREAVKIWPLENWLLLLEQLRKLGSVIQLGDPSEPAWEGVTRFAGSLSMRESMAVLSLASLHIGPDSFLMHAANGLDIPSVAIFGRSRTPEGSGYSQNANLSIPIECGPCYIHTSKGERCPHEVKCMKMISPELVLQSVLEKLR